MASIVPVNDTTDLAYDFLKQLVAKILNGSSPNFVDGATADQIANPQEGLIYLYPGFWEDQPDDAGFVNAQENEALGSEPFRNARVIIALRCKAGSSAFSGRQKVNAAAAAIEKFLRPDPGFELTLDTLPSGRRVLAYENVTRKSGGQDSSQRDQAIVEFTLRIQEAGTP